MADTGMQFVYHSTFKSMSLDLRHTAASECSLTVLCSIDNLCSYTLTLTDANIMSGEFDY